eukprot:3400838-Prymnesium_polylepis.1
MCNHAAHCCVNKCSTANCQKCHAFGDLPVTSARISLMVKHPPVAPVVGSCLPCMSSPPSCQCAGPPLTPNDLPQTAGACAVPRACRQRPAG